MFNVGKAQLKEQAMRAVFALLSKGRRLQLSFDTMINMFDKCITLILLYGCEVWGVENCKILELVQLKFYKYLLGLKQCTSTNMIYGELGIYPLEIEIKSRLFGYWVRVVCSHEQKINKQLYNALLTFSKDGTYLSKWISYIHVLLLQNGFGFVWSSKLNSDFVDVNQLKSVEN